MCVARAQTRIAELDRKAQRATATAIRGLADILWVAALSFVISMTLESTSRATLSTFKQELHHTLEETVSSSEELNSELMLAVVWSAKADEILKAHEGFDDHPLTMNHRGMVLSRPDALEALREGNSRLTTTIEQLQDQLSRTRDLKEELEHQTLEFNDLDNAEYLTFWQKVKRLWRWLVSKVRSRE